jgi:putative peptidoglycan lipid II flippase
MHDLPSKNSPTKKIVRAAGIVTVIAVAVKLLGFIEKLVLAYFFGTGMEVDAYLIAFSIPFTVFILVREMIEPAFLPTFMACIENEGEKAGWKLFSVVFNVLLILLGVVTVAGIIGAPGLVSVFAPGFEGLKRTLTVQLTRAVMPAGLFLGLSALTYITLNSYKRFAVPAFGDLLFKGCIIGVLLIAFRILGIYGLALGMGIGALARLGTHAVGLWRKRRLSQASLDVRYPPVTQMGRLMLPLVAGIAFSQLSAIIDNMFASTLETGSVSALAYAKKLVEMPVVILPYAVGVVIFPFFTELAIAKDKEKLFEMFMHALKLMTLIFFPLAVGMIALRQPIVAVLFQRGAFDVHSCEITSSGLLYYSLGLVGFAVEVILVQFYFSMSDTKTPIAIGIGCVILNILITIILIRPLAHCGIALALSISKTVKIIILYGLLKRKYGNLRLGEPFYFFVKTAIAVAAMGITVAYMNSYLAVMDISSLGGRLLGLLAATAAGILVFAAALWGMRLKEINIYWRYVRGRMEHRR